MVVHHKQTIRKRNRERETERYKRKRAKRMDRVEEKYEFSLPEVWIDDQDEKNWDKIGIHSKPVKFNWFEKFLLWIKNIFRREI